MKKLLSLIVVAFVSLSTYAQESWKPYAGDYQGNTYLSVQPDPKTTGKKSLSTLTINEQGMTIRELNTRTISFKSITLSPIEVVSEANGHSIKSHTWNYPLETSDGRYYFSYSSVTIKENESLLTDKGILIPFVIHLGNGNSLYGLFEGEKSITGITALATESKKSHTVHDFLGRKTNGKPRGLVIVSGKKVWVK